MLEHVLLLAGSYFARLHTLGLDVELIVVSLIDGSTIGSPVFEDVDDFQDITVQPMVKGCKVGPLVV